MQITQNLKQWWLSFVFMTQSLGEVNRTEKFQEQILRSSEDIAPAPPFFCQGQRAKNTWYYLVLFFLHITQCGCKKKKKKNCEVSWGNFIWFMKYGLDKYFCLGQMSTQTVRAVFLVYHISSQWDKHICEVLLIFKGFSSYCLDKDVCLAYQKIKYGLFNQLCNVRAWSIYNHQYIVILLGCENSFVRMKITMWEI